MKLFWSALWKFTLGAGLTGAILFASAGDPSWQEGWLFMGILFIPMFLAGLFMMVKAPDLLRSRLEAKETRGEQSLVIRLSGLMFLLGFLLVGLTHRCGWVPLPGIVSYGAVLLFLICYGLYGEVLRENVYLSRTIRVQTEQKVVDTGLYGIVRHPMYAVTVVMFLSMPLVLGSLPAFCLFLLYPFLLRKRILDEETFLRQELEGYSAYCEKVRYRLIPFIW